MCWVRVSHFLCSDCKLLPVSRAKQGFAGSTQNATPFTGPTCRSLSTYTPGFPSLDNANTIGTPPYAFISHRPSPSPPTAPLTPCLEPYPSTPLPSLPSQQRGHQHQEAHSSLHPPGAGFRAEHQPAFSLPPLPALPPAAQGGGAGGKHRVQLVRGWRAHGHVQRHSVRNGEATEYGVSIAAYMPFELHEPSYILAVKHLGSSVPHTSSFIQLIYLPRGDPCACSQPGHRFPACPARRHISTATCLRVPLLCRLHARFAVTNSSQPSFPL